MVYACKGGKKKKKKKERKSLCTQLAIILATLINVSYDQIWTKFLNLEQCDSRLQSMWQQWAIRQSCPSQSLASYGM